MLTNNQILSALDTRMATFLAADVWKRDPFRCVPAEPFQALLNEAADIPSVLESLDSCRLHPRKAHLIAQKAVLKAVDLLDRLSQWFQSTLALSADPLWWPVSKPDGQTCLWFSNITMANCVIHFWAFSIICTTLVRELRADFPSLMKYEITLDGQVPESAHVSRKIMAESVQILQSVEYLMQDEMKLFGIASASMPFQTAWKALETKAIGGTVIQARDYDDAIGSVISKTYRNIKVPR